MANELLVQLHAAPGLASDPVRLRQWIDTTLACELQYGPISRELAERLTQTVVETLADDPKADILRDSFVAFLIQRGYYSDALQHAQHLCQRGAASEQTLLFLIDHPSVAARVRRFDDDRFVDDLSGSAVMAAARSALESRDYFKAIEVLAAEQDGDWDHPEHAAVFGLALAEAQQFETLDHWLTTCPEEVGRYSEFWSTIGIWRMEASSFNDAIGALLKAISIDPSIEANYQRLGLCFAAIDEPRIESKNQKLLARMHGLRASALLLQSNTTQSGLRSNIASLLSEMQRPLESLLWKQRSAIVERGSLNAAATRSFVQARFTLLKSGKPDNKRSYLGLGVGSDRFPPPEIAWRTSAEPQSIGPADSLLAEPGQASDNQDAIELPIGFEDVAAEASFDFRFLNGEVSEIHRPLLYQSLGGGLAVLDFDRDGWPDIYCGQAALMLPSGESLAEEGDELFRNLGGTFRPVASLSGAIDWGYATGIASGDINQDGFLDLLVGAIGENRLLINQGDGTFVADATAFESTPDSFTATIAMGDLNADGLTDIAEANYLSDPDVYDRAKRKALTPLQFTAAEDRIFMGEPSGGFSPVILETQGSGPAASLGLIIDELDGQLGNEIFVSNDMHPNRFWSLESASQVWRESGQSRGLAFSNTGDITAGMGIATGDFDEDGLIDLHVTNFVEEPSTLYAQSGSGMFRDLAARFAMASSTTPMVGFGTQAIDADNDSIMDLAVLNGHIEDFTEYDIPLEMPPQFFRGNRRRFRLVEDQVFGNASDPCVGRVLITTDWNRDGRMDLVASYLDRDSSLLENQTGDPAKESSHNHWIQFELIGTSVERDAVGAKIRVKLGERTLTSSLTAGGYLSSNERVAAFGLGIHDRVRSLEITWPSGSVQAFGELTADTRYVLIENEHEAFPLHGP